MIRDVWIDVMICYMCVIDVGNICYDSVVWCGYCMRCMFLWYLYIGSDITSFTILCDELRVSRDGLQQDIHGLIKQHEGCDDEIKKYQQMEQEWIKEKENLQQMVEKKQQEIMVRLWSYHWCVVQLMSASYLWICREYVTEYP